MALSNYHTKCDQHLGLGKRETCTVAIIGPYPFAGLTMIHAVWNFTLSLRVGPYPLGLPNYRESGKGGRASFGFCRGLFYPSIW
jgi:hypothetical protein